MKPGSDFMLSLIAKAPDEKAFTVPRQIYRALLDECGGGPVPPGHVLEFWGPNGRVVIHELPPDWDTRKQQLLAEWRRSRWGEDAP